VYSYFVLGREKFSDLTKLWLTCESFKKPY
jgi:hypothetical protein